MPRKPISVRDAVPEDAPDLLLIWADYARRGHSDRCSVDSQEIEAAAAIARTAVDPDQRILVGLLDDQVVAAAHVMRAPVSPLLTESAVHITYLVVRDGFRRHGVGRTIVEAAVRWAEEKGTEHVLAAAAASSRDANRFFARLGLTQVAVLRAATVPTLRAKLPVEPPVAARVGPRSQRNVGQVLARRRSQRRAQDRVS